MKAEAQRIAIAEACGFRWYYTKRENGYGGTVDVPRNQWRRFLARGGIHEGIEPADEAMQKREFWASGVPNYPQSLEAMHEAEKAIPDEQTKRLYVDHLVCLMRPGEFTVMADAKRRAEAFLRTIGKWEDSE